MNRRFTQEEQPSALAATTQEENRPDFGGPLAFDKRAFRSEIAQRVHKFTDPTYKTCALNDEKQNNAETQARQAYLDGLKEAPTDTLQRIPKKLLADPNFVKEAAQIYPRILNNVDEKLLKDRTFLTSLIDLVPGVYNKADRSLREDPSFLLAAASKTTGPILVSKIPDKLRKDEELMLTVIAKAELRLGPTEKLVEQFNPSFLNKGEFWQAASLRCSDFFRQLPGSIEQETELLKAAIRSNHEVYPKLSEDLRRNDSLAETFYRAAPAHINKIPEFLLKNTEFLSRQLRFAGVGFRDLPPQYQQIPDLILAAASNNAGIVELVPKETFEKHPKLAIELATISYNTKGHLTKILGKLPNDVAEMYDNTERALKLLGLSDNTINPRLNTAGNFGQTQYGRFDATQEIIKNRWEIASSSVQDRLTELLGIDYFTKSPKTSPYRPRIAILLPHADENGAFDQKEGLLHSVDLVDPMSHSNKVILYEVNSQEGLLEALKELSSTGPVDHLIISAHGSAQAISFGGADPGQTSVTPGDPDFLTVYDRNVLRAFEGLVKDEGQVILMSCSTGSTHSAGQNIAQALHVVLPHTNLCAPQEETHVVSVVNRFTGLLETPNYFQVDGTKPVDRYEAQARPAVEFDFTRLDPKNANAIKSILKGGRYPFGLQLNRETQSVELTFNGEVEKSYVKYNPQSEKTEALTGAQLCTVVAKDMIAHKALHVLNDPSTSRLWENWDKTSDEPGYIKPNDPLLVETKKKLADELGISPNLIKIDLSRNAQSLDANVLLVINDQKLTLLSFSATLQNNSSVFLTAPVVNLDVLNRALSVTE